MDISKLSRGLCSLRSPLYRNALFLMMNSAVLGLSGFGFWVLAARLTTPDHVGIAAAMLSSLSLVSFIGTLGLEFSLIRFFPTADDKPRLVSTAITTCSLFALTLTFGFVLGQPIWAPKLGLIHENPFVAFSFVAFGVVGSLFILFDQIFVAVRRADMTVVKNLIQVTLRLGLVVALTRSMAEIGIFAAWGVASTVSVVASTALLLPHVLPGFRPQLTWSAYLFRNTIRFSVVNLVSTGLWLSPGWVLPLLVIHMMGPEMNAYFYVAWAMGGLLAAIPTAATSSLFAEGSHDHHGLSKNTMRSARLAGLGVLIAVVLMMPASPLLLRLFGGDYAEKGTTLLRILSVASIPLAVNLLYLSVSRVRRSLTDIVFIGCFVSFGTLGASAWLILRFGILGLGFAWLGTHLVLAPIAVFRLRLLLREKSTASPIHAAVSSERTL